jgi:hypothetical protein
MARYITQQQARALAIRMAVMAASNFNGLLCFFKNHQEKSRGFAAERQQLVTAGREQRATDSSIYSATA